MLKRIYIDNFRCLVDVSLSLDEINLFLGPNGSGKSSVFEALRKLQAFVGGGQASLIFKPEDLTRFSDSRIQRFELDIEGNGGLYNYELAIEHHNADVQVACQRLWFNNKLLPSFDSEEALHSAGQAWFRERMKRFIIVQAMSPFMEAESYQPEAQLTPKMQNFVSWYRHVSGNPDKVSEIEDGLQYMVENFKHFDLVKNKNNHLLNVSFSQNGNGHHPYQYRFHEMAAGNRALITLYTLIHYARFSDVTLCIDEPENFLALWEVQPLLWRLYDFCDDQVQTLLISHHPALNGLFGLSMAYWFERDNHNAPVKVNPLTDSEANAGGVPISDLVARGWIYDN